MKVRAKKSSSKAKVTLEMPEDVASGLMAFLFNAATWDDVGKPGKAAEATYEALGKADVKPLSTSDIHYSAWNS